MAMVSYDTLKALREVARRYRLQMETAKATTAKPQKRKRWWHLRKM